jgi:hypothetical protein
LPGEPLWIGFAYTDGNGYGNGSSVGNAHSNGYINGSSVGYAHGNGNADGNWCAVYPDTQTSSHRAAPSIDCEADSSIQTGTRERNSRVLRLQMDLMICSGRLATASPSCGGRVVCAC